MMSLPTHGFRSTIPLLLGSLLVAGGCAGGSGSGGSGGASGTATFFVESVNVQSGQVWQLNRPIRIQFSEPVLLSSVDLSSINVREVGGANALGEFFLENGGRTVVFQPYCPTVADLSDGALQPGGRTYELTIVGSDSGGGFTVQSTTGEILETSEQRFFSTPVSANPATLFFDPVVGPPQPIIRGRAGVSATELNATYIEVAGNADPSSRLYFRDTGAGVVLEDSSGTPATIPANLYSNPVSRFALVLVVNQPISPSTGQSTDAIRFEYDETGTGSFAQAETIPTTSELVANCTSTGAVLRVTPQGVMPPGQMARLVLTDSFEDIVDNVNQGDIADFAIAATDPVPPSGAVTDEFFETFQTSFEDDPVGTFHDFTAQLADPPAVWADGALEPGFAFEGTGGPGSDFDFEVAGNQSFTFNTSSTLLVGGPNFQKTTTVVAFGGVLNVNDLRVGPGALLKIEGPNPCTILATGMIDIQGTIDCSGVGAIGVVTLNTANTPEQGATGTCGGGRGGSGSPLTNASSPRGGLGFGAFNIADGGGQGGEAGWNIQVNKNLRRGAGGGGGRLGADQILGGLTDERYIGLNAETGLNGGPNAMGALQPCGQGPPIGGMPAPSPFKDNNPNNNFFGQLVDPVNGNVIIGELSKVWAGSGGGGGGDASRITPPATCWPNATFTVSGDEKAGGGGGGAGGFTMLAIGPIVWGQQGQVRVRGGFGGGGESTNFVDRVGSAGGGGAGGHVVIQSATRLDFSSKINGAADPTSPSADPPAILATGGQGGSGANDLHGGSTSAGGGPETPADDDACPDNDANNIIGACHGFHPGCGGDGGPGIVQLHTPLGTIGSSGSDISLPAGGLVNLEDLVFPAPVGTDFDPVTQTSPTRSFLIPQFGQFSRARSVWIPLGEGGFQTGGLVNPDFEFGGTLATGEIDVLGSTVQPLAPITNGTGTLNPAAGMTAPFLGSDGFTLVIDATIDAKYSENPNLLKGFVIELDDGATTERFEIAQASYDSMTDTLSLTASMSGPSMSAFGAGDSYAVRPAFFRIETNGTEDFLPTTAEVTILFDAAPLDPATGGPDTANSYAAVVNGDPNNLEPDIEAIETYGDTNSIQYRFIRFEVRFDIGTDINGQVDPTLPRPAVNFLRVPFSY